MALQQRAQISVNRENIQVQNIKNGAKNGLVVAGRAPLSLRSANITTSGTTGGAVKPKLKAAQLKQAITNAIATAVKPALVLPPGCLPIESLPLPPDIIDIDTDDAEHLEFSADYVKDIYEYLFRIESQFSAKPQYLMQHPSLRSHMRMILIEWLVSLQARYKLLQETLLMTVSILDRFMSETDYEVSRGKFQLVGVACMLVACKYEEMYLPSVSDFAYMCDGAYSAREILWMERMILETLKFEFAKPLSAHFLRRFSKAGGADSTTHTVAKYLLELALYDYSLVHCKPSVIAASSLYIAGLVTDVVGWDETLVHYSSYQPTDLDFVVSKLAELASTADSNKYLKTTYKKYAADKFQRVAKSVLLCEDVQKIAQRNRNAAGDAAGIPAAQPQH